MAFANPPFLVSITDSEGNNPTLTNTGTVTLTLTYDGDVHALGGLALQLSDGLTADHAHVVHSGGYTYITFTVEFPSGTSGQTFPDVGVLGIKEGRLFYTEGRDEGEPDRHYIHSFYYTPTGGGPQVNFLCFCDGTAIGTPEGETLIEALKPGDLVLTSDGRAEPVRWIGRQTVASRFADPARAFPVRIRAGAFGDGAPARDLRVSPDHAFLLDGVLVQAGALVNGLSIVRETDIPESFTYRHVELSSHALILAEGAPAETFIDNVDRMAFDNWAEREALGPSDGDLSELPLPRAKSARQVPRKLRDALAARAADLFGSGVARVA